MSYFIVRRNGKGAIKGSRGPYKTEGAAASAAQKLADETGMKLTVERNPWDRERAEKRLKEVGAQLKKAPVGSIIFLTSGGKRKNQLLIKTGADTWSFFDFSFEWNKSSGQMTRQMLIEDWSGDDKYAWELVEGDGTAPSEAEAKSIQFAWNRHGDKLTAAEAYEAGPAQATTPYGW